MARERERGDPTVRAAGEPRHDPRRRSSGRSTTSTSRRTGFHRLSAGDVWAVDSTGEDDVKRFLTGDRSLRVHAIQPTGSSASLGAALRLPVPPGAFDRYPRSAGYWVSREPVEPLEVPPLGDLGAARRRRHRAEDRPGPAGSLAAHSRFNTRVQRHPAAQPDRRVFDTAGRSYEIASGLASAAPRSTLVTLA